LALFLLVTLVDFENLSLDRTISRDRIYVSWSEKWDLGRYVDHYLRERDLAPSDAMRATIRARIAGYPWPAPWKKADMDRWLDAKGLS
jgi:hypothetical protein